MGIVFLALIASFSFSVVMGVKNKIIPLSSYYMFVAFTLLYSVAAYLNYSYSMVMLSLSQDQEIIKKLLISAVGGILAFTITYFYGAYKSKEFYNVITKVSNKKVLIFIYIIIFFIVSAFASQYGWHASSRDGVGYSFATVILAYAKYTFVIIGVFFLVNDPKDKKTVFFILITQLVLMLLDGGRTTFFGLIVAYGWVLSRSGVNFNLKSLLFFILIVFVLLGVRGIAMGTGFFDSVRIGFLAEGVFGGYTALQSIDYVHNYNNTLLLGISYVLDPIIYLLPRVIRDEYLFFGNVTSSYYGAEKFAPMGGFFWVSESYANFGVVGGVIVGAFYGKMLRVFEEFSNSNIIYSAVFITTVGSILSKVYFANAIKVFVFSMLVAMILKIFFSRSLRLNI